MSLFERHFTDYFLFENISVSFSIFAMVLIASLAFRRFDLVRFAANASSSSLQARPTCSFSSDSCETSAFACPFTLFTKEHSGRFKAFSRSYNV